jgi:transposase
MRRCRSSACKKSKELDDNSPTKNDVKDAKVIAQLVKDGRYAVSNIPQRIYAELREAMKIREHLSTDLRVVQGLSTTGWTAISLNSLRYSRIGDVSRVYKC